MSVATSPPLFSEPGAGAPQRPSRLHAHVAIGSFAVQTLSLGVYAWLSRARAAAWNDAVAGRVTIADSRHAHHVVVVAARSTWVTLLLGAVCVSLWSGRVVSSARARGMRVSPGRARWMWFIPLLGIPLSIRELQRAVSGTDYSTHRLRPDGLPVGVQLAAAYGREEFHFSQTDTLVSSTARLFEISRPVNSEA